MIPINRLPIRRVGHHVRMSRQDVLTHATFAGLVAYPKLMLAKRILSLTDPANSSGRLVANNATTLKPVVGIGFLESLGRSHTNQL